MKLPPFDWIPVKTVTECVDVLASNDGVESKIIAGGQSLLPLMALGMASPSLLVDVNGVEGLGEVVVRGDQIDIGALVRHSELIAHADRIADLRIVGTAARHIGHLGIRNRGTLGGSLSHADPASELPALMLLLKAGIVCESKSSGPRTIQSGDFFLGPYTTAMEEHEMLTRVIVPRPVNTRFGFVELAARHGDFATAGAAVAVSYTEEGKVGDLRAVIFATTSKPTVVGADVDLPIGEKINSVDWKALASVLASSVPAGKKRELTKVMLSRAFMQAATMDDRAVH